MHECPFSQSGVELVDFCQSDRLKMVSAFSYKHGQNIFFFFLNAEGCFFSFLVRCLLMDPTHFSIGLLIFSVFSHTWETGHLSVIRVADFFFSS